MPDAFICDAIRTPVGRYGGSLAGAAGPAQPRSEKVCKTIGKASIFSSAPPGAPRAGAGRAANGPAQGGGA